MTLITSKRWIVNRPAFFLLDMVFSHWLAVPSSEASRMHSLPRPSCWFQAIPSVCQNIAYEAVNWDNHLWLVDLTILKNISQWKGLSHIWLLYGYWWLIIISGWWLSPTPLKNMKVKWEYEIPNIWEKNMFQTTNQKSTGIIISISYGITNKKPACRN
jgi:hypothetical protein